MSGELYTPITRESVLGLVKFAKAARQPLSPRLQFLAECHGIDPEEETYTGFTELVDPSEDLDWKVRNRAYFEAIRNDLTIDTSNWY